MYSTKKTSHCLILLVTANLNNHRILVELTLRMIPTLAINKAIGHVIELGFVALNRIGMWVPCSTLCWFFCFLVERYITYYTPCQITRSIVNVHTQMLFLYEKSEHKQLFLYNVLLNFVSSLAYRLLKYFMWNLVYMSKLALLLL